MQEPQNEDNAGLPPTPGGPTQPNGPQQQPGPRGQGPLNPNQIRMPNQPAPGQPRFAGPRVVAPMVDVIFFCFILTTS